MDLPLIFLYLLFIYNCIKNKLTFDRREFLLVNKWKISSRDIDIYSLAVLNLCKNVLTSKMFGSSRYVVNLRGLTDRRSLWRLRENPKKHMFRRSSDGDVDRLCTWRIPTRLTRIISSTLYRTKRIQRNEDEVVILACVAFYRFSVCTECPGIGETAHAARYFRWKISFHVPLTNFQISDIHVTFLTIESRKWKSRSNKIATSNSTLN